MNISDEPESYVRLGPEGTITSYVGPDATRLYAASMCAVALRLYVKCGMLPAWGVTLSRMLQAAGAYTGRSYTRGPGGARQAAQDLESWCSAMRSALPILPDISGDC